MSARELRRSLGGIHEEMPDWVEEFLAARGFAWQQLERGELWGGRLPFAGLPELQQFLVMADPVRFAECVFVELEEDGQPPWRLWPYQKVSARYRSNTLHQCGAEVGKTREIVILHLWEAVTARGNSLIGAALDGHLDLIWREIIGQAKVNPWLDAQVDWERTHVKPYKDLVLANGNTIFFRPAGTDGSAFRGVHVRRRASLDEAPKVKSKEAMGNFFSRCKPGAEIRLYGTPDGDRDCEFYQLCVRHQEVDPMAPPPLPTGTRDEPVDPYERSYAKFRWAKTLQPAPYWSDARERQLIEEYSGRDSSEFQQNVLGHWGDPAQTVFPWSRLSACLRYIPDAIIVKLLVDDATGQLYADAYRLSPAYQVKSALGDESGEATTDPLVRFFNDQLPVSSFPAGGDRKLELVDRWEAYLRPLVAPVAAAGRSLVCGVDYGASVSEPTEIFAAEVIGELTRVLLRVQLKRFDYDQQECVIRALQRILAPCWGWAGDSTGNGSVVEHYLQHPLGLELVDYTGVVFNATTLDLDPATGQPLHDADDPEKVRKVTWKEKATQLLEADLQRQRLELPYDPDVMVQWSSHTATILASGRRQFAHLHDHTIDAVRCLELRLYLLRVVAAGAPPLEFAVPPGARRPSSTLGDAF